MELADNEHISDFTKRTLAQFDWKDGDPIPTELGALLMQLKDSSPRSARTDVLIDINVVPDEGKAAVKSLLAAAKEFASKKVKDEQLAAKLSSMSPSVAAAFRDLQAQEETQANIVDDRETAPEPAPTVPEPPPSPPSEAAVEPTEPEDPAPAPMTILPFCPRCGWDMRQKFDVPVTDVDKHDFLAAVLGNQRFKRDFELMGGKMILTFRTLMAEENKLVHRQLVFDQAAHRIATEAEWFTQMIEYRLAASLEKVTDGKGRTLSVVPEMHEFKYTPPPEEPLQTPLVAMLDYVNKTVLAHEVIRRLAGQHLRHFQRLVEALEAMALEPSFWSGIE